MNVLDLNNSESLEIATENMSNFDATFGANIVAQNLQMLQAQKALAEKEKQKEKQDLLKAGLGLAGTLTTGLATGLAARASQNCKKPLFPENPFNRSNWQAYRDCVTNEERERQREFELQLAQKSESEKFLGMPKNVGIAVTIGGGLLIIGTIVYFATRK